MLDVQEALEALRGDDPRPLLILRECEGCKNKEGDRLKRTLRDERFLLAMPWFHCVKLGNDAMDPDQPYSKLFTGSIPPHVVLSTWDGKRIINVSRAGQKECWQSMQKVLRLSYKQSATKAMKGLTKLLEKYDALDLREQGLKEQLAHKEERGLKRRAKELRKDILEVGQDRDKVIEKEKKLYDLGFRFVKERDEEEGD